MRNDGLVALRKELEARGYFRRATRQVLGELALFVFITVVCLVVFIAWDNFVIRAASLVVMTLSTLGVTTNTHTSSHYATSDRRRLNEILTYFGYPFFVGFSATYWWQKHVVVHHPAPNVIGVDDDVNLLPFFALNTGELEGISRLKRLYYREQWVVIPFAIFLNTFNLEVAGWRHLIRALCDPTERRQAHWIDLSALLLQWVVWIVLPMLFFPPAQVLLFYLLRRSLFSYALFAAFVPAHFPSEALFVDKGSKDVDVVLLQTATTVNLRTGFIGRLLCSGVDYQIEHHLFPGMSHVYYPEISKIVKAYCQAHNYPYRTLGWGEAVIKSLMVFYLPKRVHALGAASSSQVSAICP